MPKAKKFVSRKRARSYLTRRKKRVRRVKKFRRVKGKRIWYKKYKAKYSKSKKGVRHKYTLWLDLAQFLSLPYTSFIHPVCQAVKEDSINGTTTTAAFNDSCGQFLGDLFTVCSTADVSAGTRPESTNTAKFMHFTAWNPFLCPETLGGEFNEYLIKHNEVKYSGVKVSWKPTIKYVNVRQPSGFKQDKVVPVSGATTAQMRYNYQEIIQGQSYPGVTPSESGRPMRIDVSSTHEYAVEAVSGIQKPITVPDWDNSSYGGFSTPPVLRLWINFDKQGYEARDILQEQAYDDGKANAGVAITGSRYMTGKIVDDYGQYMHLPLVKSFSLTRPFKFYVRPKVVSQVYEPPTNTAVIRNRETYGSAYQQDIAQKIPNGGIFATSLKTMPYFSVGCLYPYTCPYDTPPTKSENLNIWLINNVKQKGFTDPILFGWMLTDDQLHEGKSSCPFTVVDNTPAYTQGTRTLQFNVESLQFLRGIGKFKVTFYTKWRGKNPYHIPRSISNAWYNAQWQKDAYDPYAMDTEDGNKPDDEKN